MVSDMPTPDNTGPSCPRSASAALKPQRVLACIRCQQRKVKCDRRVPCATCVKANLQCVPASHVSHQRRRRFPERKLLDRLLQYESLLTIHNIPFEPMHASPTDATANQANRLVDATTSPRPTHSHRDSSQTSHDKQEPGDDRATNFWHAMNSKSQQEKNDDADENSDHDSDSSIYMLRHRALTNAWDQIYDQNDHLLFGSRNASIHLSTLHPTQALIFKLWQTYLDNVNPLLKVTHTPTLQTRFIDAASDLDSIPPPLEALMFSIYCMAVFSMGNESCISTFGQSRVDALRRFQLGCREALLNCSFLKTGDRDCLTALHFYLITVKSIADPRSLSSLLGSAVRIAQRMGIHDDFANSSHTALEAEMRRRLWWSLVLFDARIAEMTDFTVGTLVPTWDCAIPLNVNDFDLRAEMKHPPSVFGHSSEALFAVVRSEFGDFTRQSSFYLDFVNPKLKSVARRSYTSDDGEVNELAAFEKMTEKKYLKHCDPDNALHFMTIWTARASIARSRFMHHLADTARSEEQDVEARRYMGITYALGMLECDSKLMQSPLLRGFRWHIYLNFPFPAYVHLAEELRKRPLSDEAEMIWNAMSENATARFDSPDIKDSLIDKKDNAFATIFANTILRAWAAREAACAQAGQQAIPFPIVANIRQRLAGIKALAQSKALDASTVDSSSTSHLTPESMVYNNFDTSQVMTGHDPMGGRSSLFQTVPGQGPMAFDMNQWGWPVPNWNTTYSNTW